MAWIEFHIKTTAHHAEELSHQLTLLGALAVTLKDAGDEPIYEPSPTTPRIWSETIVVGLFEQDQPIEPISSFLEKKQKEHILQSFHILSVEDDDWVRRSLDSFKPLHFGHRLWICPSWYEPPDPHAINIILDPGLAFGTGTHPTTALCLEWLDEHVASEELAIDYGCGSGILGIAAQKLGVKQIIAIDNDPQALCASRQNASQNALHPPVFIAQSPNEPVDKKADIVLANILEQPLIALANQLAYLTKRGGHVVLSGILTNQIEAVTLAYEPWFKMMPATLNGQWVRLVGIKR